MTGITMTHEKGEPVGLIEAIHDAVREAFDNQPVVKCGIEAQRLAAQFPTSGMTVDQIADMVLRAAIETGVPAFLSEPE